MEELEDIDALINNVESAGEKRDNGRTAAQIKIKPFANNFANIGNIGEAQRKTEAKKVAQTTSRKDGGGETAGHICPPSPSPSPSPPPSVSRGKAAKRSSTSRSKSTSGSPTKRRRVETSYMGEQLAKSSQTCLVGEEKTKDAFHKSCLFFPKDVQLTPKETVDVTFEVKELKDVNIGLEVKSCFSFSYDRSLLSSREQQQLVSSCLIDAKPSQTVFGGRVVAAFTNSQECGNLKLAKGMKIGVCRFKPPTVEQLGACANRRDEITKVNTSSIDSAANSAPTRETQADTALTQTAAEEKSGAQNAQNENKKIVGIHADNRLLQKKVQQDIVPDSIGMNHIKTGCDTGFILETSSNELTGGTLFTDMGGVSTTSWHLKEDSGNVAKCVDGAKPVKVFPEDLVPSQSSLTASPSHLRLNMHNQNQHSSTEETEDKKFDIKREDLKDVKCPDLFLENIRSGMTALEYLDPDICGFVELYFAWCHAEGNTPTSEEGDELLQQVSMLDVSLLELTKVIQDNWSSGEREESEWKEIFGQKFSLVQSEMLPEFGKIVRILLLDFRTNFDTKKPEELMCHSDADSVAKKVSLDELHIDEAEQAAIKEAVMANAEKQLQQLREENEKLVAVNEQLVSSFVETAKEHNSGNLQRRSKPDDKNDHRPSAASFFHDVLERDSDAKYNDEFELIGAVGRVEDYLPKKHIFRVVCEDPDDGMDILLASKSAEMFLGKRIQFNATPLKDRHHKVFINERTREGAYRVTKIYSSMLDDIDSEQDLLSRLKREPSEGSSSLVSSSTDVVVHKIEDRFEENMEREDAREDYRRGRESDVKWKIRRTAKECSHYVVPSFCKFKQCDGKCGDQHEFTSLQHKILLEDVGSYCFRFPKFTCHKVKCGFPHYSWLSLCRMVTEGLTKRKRECMNEGPCSQSGCRQLSETLLKSFKLCRPPCENERRCKLIHTLPSHLQLPQHCTAFLSDSCSVSDCKSPHIPFSNINEIFVQKRSALQLFCEQCYTERTLERQKESSPEVKFLSLSPSPNRDEKESWRAEKRRRRSRSESEKCPKQSIFSRLGGPPVQPDRESRTSPRDDRSLERSLERERCDDDNTKHVFAKRLKELEDEICRMLEEKESSIPLGQIPVKYNQMYKRQIVLADYGFQRGQLSNLVAAMDERLQITGEEKHWVVSLRSSPKIVKFSRSTFENNSKKMLQVQGTVKLKNLMSVYSRMFGIQHTLESYGFQSVDEMVKAGEQTFNVIDVGDEKVAKLRIGRKQERRTSKEDVAPTRQMVKSNHEQRLVYIQQQGRNGKGGDERRKRIEERREIERRVEARRGLRRDHDFKWDGRYEIGEQRREKRRDESREGRRKRESGCKRERSGDQRSSRDTRSQSVRSSREEVDDLIEDVVGDPDDEGELLQIIEQMEQ